MAYIEVPRLRLWSVIVTFKGCRSDVLDFTLLQVFHVDMDAIYRNRPLVIEPQSHRREERTVPSDKFPERPNSIFAMVVVED